VRIWPTQQQAQRTSIDGAWLPLEFQPPGNKLVGYHTSGKLGTFDLETGEIIDSNPAPALIQQEGLGIPVDQTKSTRIERIESRLIKVTALGVQTEVTISSELKSIDSLSLSPDASLPTLAVQRAETSFSGTQFLYGPCSLVPPIPGKHHWTNSGERR